MPVPRCSALADMSASTAGSHGDDRNPSIARASPVNARWSQYPAAWPSLRDSLAPIQPPCGLTMIAW